MEQYPAYTLKQVKNRLELELPHKPHVCISSIAGMLDGQLVTLKKLEDAAIERNADVIKRQQREYANWLIWEVINRNMIHVDKCDFNLYTRRTRRRAFRGVCAVRQIAACCGKNLNLLLVIVPNIGVVYRQVIVGTVNSVTFCHFLDNSFNAIGEEIDATIIMDNAPIHRGAEMDFPIHLIKKIPPYSPMLSAIENAFSCLKYSVKANITEQMAKILDRFAAADANVPLMTYRTDIFKNIVISCVEDNNVINANKYQNWHSRAMGFVPACVDLKDIVI